MNTPKPLIPDQAENKVPPAVPDALYAKPGERISVIEKIESYLLYHSEEIEKYVGYLDYIESSSKVITVLKYGLKGISKGLKYLAKYYGVEVKKTG